MRQAAVVDAAVVVEEAQELPELAVAVVPLLKTARPEPMAEVAAAAVVGEREPVVHRILEVGAAAELLL
jgi:hypothetical protein